MTKCSHHGSKAEWGLRWLSHLALPRYKSFHMCCFFDVLTFFLLSLFSFRELYPALAMSLQSVHGVLDSSSPLLPLQLQRVQALLSLLTQITNTAGCHQELQTSMVGYGPRSSLLIQNKMKKKKKPSFHLYVTSQLTGRRVPPTSPGVLGSRHRVAAITVGAFERFHEES